MSYTVESESYRPARRRRRTAITLIVLVLILAGTYYYASSYITQPDKGSTATATATCTPTIPATGAVAPQQITLNVYNATRRAGLAASVGKLLKDRGYRVGTIANYAGKKPVPQPAVVAYGPAGERAAQVVVTLVAGAVPVADTRADASVDLVIGDGFAELTPAPPAPTTTPAAGGC